MSSAMQTAEGVLFSRIANNVTEIDAGWTSADNVAWPGIDFDPDDSWMRPTVVWGESVMETHGSTGINTVVGVLVVQLFARPGLGYGVLNAYADTVRDLFTRFASGSVTCYAASGPTAIEGDTHWLQVNISIPFIVEEQT